MVEAGGKSAILMGMARTAELSGNNVEAISYYNRVLEDDPTASEAWLGKGRAAGWLSTLASLRLKEATVAFGHAVASAGGDREAIARQATTELTRIGTAVQDMGWRHYFDFPTVDDSWDLCVGALNAVLEAQISPGEWGVNDADSLTLTILVSKGLIDHGGAPLYERFARMMFEDATARMVILDPAYEPPGLEAVTIVERVATDTKAQVERINADNETEFFGYIVAFVIVVILAIVIGASNS